MPFWVTYDHGGGKTVHAVIAAPGVVIIGGELAAIGAPKTALAVPESSLHDRVNRPKGS